MNHPGLKAPQNANGDSSRHRLIILSAILVASLLGWVAMIDRQSEPREVPQASGSEGRATHGARSRRAGDGITRLPVPVEELSALERVPVGSSTAVETLSLDLSAGTLRVAFVDAWGRPIVGGAGAVLLRVSPDSAEASESERGRQIGLAFPRDGYAVFDSIPLGMTFDVAGHPGRYSLGWDDSLPTAAVLGPTRDDEVVTVHLPVDFERPWIPIQVTGIPEIRGSGHPVRVFADSPQVRPFRRQIATDESGLAVVILPETFLGRSTAIWIENDDGLGTEIAYVGEVPSPQVGRNPVMTTRLSEPPLILEMTISAAARHGLGRSAFSLFVDRASEDGPWQSITRRAVWTGDWSVGMTWAHRPGDRYRYRAQFRELLTGFQEAPEPVEFEAFDRRLVYTGSVPKRFDASALLDSIGADLNLSEVPRSAPDRR